MHLVTGDMIWTSINDIPNKYTYLSEDINCQVVVIGAGITGAICAYYFTMAGINTVLVDKNIIGYGSTSCSTSILQYEIDYDLIGLKGLIGEEKAVQAFKMTEKAVYDIDKLIKDIDEKCGFDLRGCFYYTNKQNDINMLKKEYELRKKHGFDVEFLEKKEAKEKFSLPVKAGIYSNSGAGEIDPYKFAHSLIAKAIEKGLKVFENTEVINFNPENNSVILTTRNKFKINAKKAIIATGFEARKYITKKTAILTRSFTVVTKPVKSFAGWFKRCIIRDTNDPYIYLRTTSDDRIIIGGEDISIGGESSKVANLTNNDFLSIEKYDILTNKLKEYFPDIPNLEIEYKFSGFFGESKDGLPFIGEYLNYPNCYFSLCYGSNGILYAIIAAQLLRDLYLGNTRSELGLFDISR